MNKKEREREKRWKEKRNIIKRKGSSWLFFFERILIRHTNWLVIKAISFNFLRFCEIETKTKEAWFSFLFYLTRETISSRWAHPREFVPFHWLPLPLLPCAFSTSPHRSGRTKALKIRIYMRDHVIRVPLSEKKKERGEMRDNFKCQIYDFDDGRKKMWWIRARIKKQNNFNMEKLLMRILLEK